LLKENKQNFIKFVLSKKLMIKHWLPSAEPVSNEGLEELARRSNHMARISAPPGFTIRKDPSEGKKGPLNLNDAVVQAVFHTVLCGYPFNRDRDGLYALPAHFIKEPSKLFGDESYHERLKIMTRLVRGCINQASASGYLDTGGWVFDPDSGYIQEYEEEPYYWVGQKHGFEALFDTSYPSTKLLFKEIYGQKEFESLKEKHEKENIFQKGPIDLVLPIHAGWRIPVIGVKEIFYGEYGTMTQLHAEGITQKIVPESWKFVGQRLNPERNGIHNTEYPPTFLKEFSSFKEV
jgi:hypothetical protein